MNTKKRSISEIRVIRGKNMSDIVISVENVSKYYRLGLIGGGTLRDDFERWWAKVRGKPDSLLKIGLKSQIANPIYFDEDSMHHGLVRALQARGSARSWTPYDRHRLPPRADRTGEHLHQ
jgi:hypothetical protein